MYTYYNQVEYVPQPRKILLEKTDNLNYNSHNYNK